MMKYKFYVLMLFCPFLVLGQDAIVFNNVNEAFAFADKNSTVIKTGSEQMLIAKWTKIAAIGNTLNLRNPVSFSITDNTQLPVSFLPAEAFGGQAGQFKQITLGQKYQNNFTFAPAIDIINANAWAKIKSASVNSQLVHVNNLLVKKSLQESIAAAYFNVVSIQSQKELIQQNLKNSDSIVAVVSKKYAEGIVRKTDENDAIILRETIAEKLSQIEFQEAQQLNILKSLCDIDTKTSLKISQNNSNSSITNSPALQNDLQTKQANLQYEFAKAEWTAAKMVHLPTVSLVSSFSWQNNSNTKLIDNSQKWIASNFVGLRFNINLPTDMNKIAAQATAKYNTIIAKYNVEHTSKANEINNQQLLLDFEKANSQYNNLKKIQSLKEDNYTKFFNLYKENLISIDRLLNAYNDKIVNEISLVNALAILNNNATKISINNTIK